MSEPGGEFERHKIVFNAHSSPEGGPLSVLDGADLLEIVKEFFLLRGDMSEERAATRARAVIAGQDENFVVEIKSSK